MQRLKNKVVIVTGAAGGIGAAIAKLFAEEGAKVLATDIQEEKLEAWVHAAKKVDGLLIEHMKHNVTSETDWKHVSEKAIALFGKINILVNNAGVYPGFVDCEHTTIDLWGKVISINLTGPYIGCKTCIPHIITAGGGSIINIASIAGIVGGNGTAYSTSKGGLIALSKDLAITLAKDKIRVNTICPGAILTPMTEEAMKAPEMKEVIKNMAALGRIGDPIEIAMGALYLASDEATYTTGTELVIDGGATSR
jgi:cyclopentanol dehydrogenase